jgi:hypothetical protein
MLCVAFASCLRLEGQSLTATLSVPKDKQDDTQIAIPGGAGATVTGSGTAGAGPLLGFQVWKQDNFLLSSFFSFSAPQAISGQQHDFGAFLLNPPGQGTSYSFAGNRVVPCFLFVTCDKTTAPVFVGIAGRAGVTNTSWQTGSGSTSQSVSGTVAYITPAILLTSKTYVTGETNEEQNQYQFGVSAGPGFRYIAGDLAQSSNDTFRQQTLGTTKKSMLGVEIEFFVRLNSFRPFVRFSRFTLPNRTDISGFSGTQALFGVDVLSAIFKKSLEKK